MYARITNEYRNGHIVKLQRRGVSNGTYNNLWHAVTVWPKAGKATVVSARQVAIIGECKACADMTSGMCYDCQIADRHLEEC